MKARIISNIYSLADTDKLGLEIELCKYPKPPTGIGSVVKMFLKSFRYDYIVLNFIPFDVWLVAFLKLICPLNRCRLVTLDLILTVPRNFRDRLLQAGKFILLRQVHFSMVYFKDTSGYRRYFGVKPEKFRYVPYKINAMELIQKQPVSDHGYVFCGGRSRRDFATLFDAVRDLPFPVRLVVPVNSVLRDHGSYLDESRVPASVEVIHDDGTVESFIQHIAASRLAVLPILKENLSASGLGVYIMCMALRKCVVISAGPGVDDVLTSEQAVIVPPEDPRVLKEAIRRAYTDDDYRRQYEENGFRYAMELGGDTRLRESIISVLSEDLRARFQA